MALTWSIGLPYSVLAQEIVLLFDRGGTGDARAVQVGAASGRAQDERVRAARHGLLTDVRHDAVGRGHDDAVAVVQGGADALAEDEQAFADPSQHQIVLRAPHALARPARQITIDHGRRLAVRPHDEPLGLGLVAGRPRDGDGETAHVPDPIALAICLGPTPSSACHSVFASFSFIAETRRPITGMLASNALRFAGALPPVASPNHVTDFAVAASITRTPNGRTWPQPSRSSTRSTRVPSALSAGKPSYVTSGQPSPARSSNSSVTGANTACGTTFPRGKRTGADGADELLAPLALGTALATATGGTGTAGTSLWTGGSIGATLGEEEGGGAAQATRSNDGSPAERAHGRAH